ncbi:MAG: PqqD family protein [candidate division WOR-3 bacterium]|nr:PqqD family protein [candidate division WOR-3 bacterium]
MDADIELNQIYVPSDDIVARDIEGEVIIVPLVAGIGDMEDELFSLNDTGKDIWRRLDGKATLAGVANVLVAEYSAPPDEIERDVIGLVGELVRRKMLVVKPGA